MELVTYSIILADPTNMLVIIIIMGNVHTY